MAPRVAILVVDGGDHCIQHLKGALSTKLTICPLVVGCSADTFVTLLREVEIGVGDRQQLMLVVAVDRIGRQPEAKRDGNDTLLARSTEAGTSHTAVQALGNRVGSGSIRVG